MNKRLARQVPLNKLEELQRRVQAPGLTELEAPMTVRVGQVRLGKGEIHPASEFCNSAALILYRVMRQRLAASQSGLSPERALSLLRRIQHHRVTLNNTQPISGISSISQEQTGILSA